MLNINLSNINCETCINSKRYKGFIIDTNVNEDFHTTYYSVINPRKFFYIHGQIHNVHVHADKESVAKKIVDCYYAKNKTRYGRSIRNKALTLDGLRVYY